MYGTPGSCFLLWLLRFYRFVTLVAFGLLFLVFYSDLGQQSYLLVVLFHFGQELLLRAGIKWLALPGESSAARHMVQIWGRLSEVAAVVRICLDDGMLMSSRTVLAIIVSTAFSDKCLKSILSHRGSVAVWIIVLHHTVTVQNWLLQDIFSAFIFWLVFAHCQDLLQFIFVIDSLQLVVMNFLIEELILPPLLENVLF